MMRNVRKFLVTVVAVTSALACAPESDNYAVKRYLCNFEGEYWDALIDSNPNGDNLLNGSIATSWCDEASGLAGEVTQPYPGYWEGVALSSHCSKDLTNDGQPDDQLYAYADGGYSGKNFLICNCFFGGVELRFERESSFIESIMVANTTYSRNVVTNGNHLTPTLGANESIWVVADGYIDGSDEVQATSKFYLYKDGKAAFEGWERWYLTSMCKVDRLTLRIEWDGTGEYNPYPAYFALDDIVVVRQELQENL